MIRIWFFLLTIMVAAPLLGEEPAGDDPVARHLFPPELVMRYQSEIKLNENQQTAIKADIQKAQTKFIDFQWQMQSEAKNLEELLQTHPIDETKVMAQVDKVLNLEREIKKTQLSLLIRIKNQLSQLQQTDLQELRKKGAH